MITTVINEAPFQVLTSSFSISPSTTGYDLEISADGTNFSKLFTVSANTTKLVTNVASGSYYRLKGNDGEVKINWRTNCNSEGGDVDLTNYWTSAQTQDAIDEAVSGITVDLSDYYTSAQTDSHIQNAVADFVTSGQVETQITSKGYTTSGQVETQITSKGYATESAVTSAITALENELGNFVTSAQVQTQIASAVTEIENELSAYATSGDIQTINERINTKDEVISIALNELHEQIENIDIPDVSNFVTSAQVQTQITSAVTAIENELSEAEQVTSTALVDINSRMVSSELIKTIVKMSQAEYDALATKDNNTLYIIG